MHHIATILKAAPEGGHKPNALFARFNTLFEKSTQHYTDLSLIHISFAFNFIFKAGFFILSTSLNDSWGYGCNTLNI